MHATTQLEDLRALHGGPVVTLFLDVRASRPPSEVLQGFEALRARALSDVAALDPVARACASVGLERMAARLGEGLAPTVRGVVFVAAGDVLKVVELPRPVADEVVVDAKLPLCWLVGALESVDDFMVVLIDGRRARFFMFRSGTLEDRRRVDIGDGDEPSTARSALGSVTDTALEIVNAWKPTEVFLGGDTRSVNLLQRCLHPFVTSRLVERLDVPFDATEAEITAAAIETADTVERRRVASIVRHIRAGLSGRTTAGVGPTLRALAAGRVDQLVVGARRTIPGGRCVRCGALRASPGTCPACGGTVEPIADLVNEAIGMAMAAGADVLVCRDGELDSIGGLGAVVHPARQARGTAPAG